MNKIKISLFLILAAISITQSTPTWMDIGTYGLTQTESACWENLPFNTISDAFYNAAVSNRNIIIAASPQYPPNPSRHVNLIGSNVTISRVRPNLDREYCDFICFAGHGSQMGASVYTDAHQCKTGWYTTTAGEFAFGSSYTRWVYFMTCSLFAGDVSDPSFWASWQNAFHGVQVILGYRGYFNMLANYQINTVNRFWVNWIGTGIAQRTKMPTPTTFTSAQLPMWNAHADACGECIYYASNRSLTVIPAAMTASPTGAEADAFYKRTYSNATSDIAPSKAIAINWRTYTRVEPM